MESENHMYELIARYLNSQCSDEELAVLKSWLAHSKDNQRMFYSIKDTWDATVKTNVNSEKYLLEFYKQRLEKRSILNLSIWKQAMAVAAVLAIGLISGILLSRENNQENRQMVVYSVPMGSKSKILLADGTEVKLNSGSELSYRADFSSDRRLVSLTGEGYFHVTSDQKHPFTVHTKDFDAIVTGTQFNICSYNDDTFASATLVDGKVSLCFADSDKTVIVMPGQKLILDRKTRSLTSLKTDTQTETAWKDGQFMFRNIPFPDLVQRLERWYDVKLTFNSLELSEYKYTGKFRNQETIWQVLDALALTSPISYRKSNFREFKIIYKPK
jgi:transmembrane sensor